MKKIEISQLLTRLMNSFLHLEQDKTESINSLNFKHFDKICKKQEKLIRTINHHLKTNFSKNSHSSEKNFVDQLIENIKETSQVNESLLHSYQDMTKMFYQKNATGNYDRQGRKNNDLNFKTMEVSG